MNRLSALNYGQHQYILNPILFKNCMTGAKILSMLCLGLAMHIDQKARIMVAMLPRTFSLLEVM